MQGALSGSIILLHDLALWQARYLFRHDHLVYHPSQRNRQKSHLGWKRLLYVMALGWRILKLSRT
jgi:hypothetical protein